MDSSRVSTHVESEKVDVPTLSVQTLPESAADVATVVWEMSPVKLKHATPAMPTAVRAKSVWSQSRAREVRRRELKKKRKMER